MAKVHSGEDILLKASTPLVRRTNIRDRQTTERQTTDGFAREELAYKGYALKRGCRLARCCPGVTFIVCQRIGLQCRIRLRFSTLSFSIKLNV